MSRHLTKEEVIRRIEAVFGDSYDLSLMVFETTRKPVRIICKKHGPFKKQPFYLFKGKGCKHCTWEEMAAKRSHSLDEFIKKARLVHGDKYDYSLVEYKNSKSSISIICSSHGLFKQQAGSHLSGNKCPDCALIKRAKVRTKTFSEFLKDAIAIHGNKYDYSLCEPHYKNARSKIPIKCKKHGVYYQQASKHTAVKQGCVHCGNDKNKQPHYDTKEFIKRAKKIHGNKYDYSLSEYKGSCKKIKIICPVHGEFMQYASVHLANHNCPSCSIESVRSKNSLSKAEFIEKAEMIHGKLYDYSLVKYKNYLTKVKVVCRKHGVFSVSPSNHLRPQCCPRCKTSHGETKIRKFLKSQNIAFIDQHPVKGMHRKYLINFHLPDYNLFIEYHGKQHYERNPHFHRKKSDFQRQLTRDQKLRDLCQQRGIDLLEIGYFDFDRIKEILSEKLLGVEVKRSKQLKLQL